MSREAVISRIQQLTTASPETAAQIVDLVLMGQREDYENWRHSPADYDVRKCIDRLLKDGALDGASIMSWDGLEEGIRTSARRPLEERIAELEQAVEDLTAGHTHGEPTTAEIIEQDIMDERLAEEGALLEPHECGCDAQDVHGGDVCRKTAEPGMSSCLGCAGMGCSTGGE